MKKTIIAVLLVVATGTAFAQQAQTPAPAPAKQFQPDFSKPVTIQIKVPLGILHQYTYSVANPGFENSDLQGKQIVSIKQGNAALADSIIANYTRIMQAQHDTWAADTLKQFKNKKP